MECPPNYELQCYTDRPENIRVSNGRLIIEARGENYGEKQYTSGKIIQKSGRTSYGAYVIRAKLPNAKFLWPALWTLTADGCKYEEIDIVEYRGQVNNQIECAAHFGRDWQHLKSFGRDKVFSNKNFSADFHEFAILWLANSLQWYVDNEKLFEVSTLETDWINNSNKPCSTSNQKPFSEITSLILNIAVGGSFFPVDKYGSLTLNDAYQWPNPKLEVDWVRIYQE
ncbi:endo-1:3(4)-beta-glucanase-like protein [Leptotrombidium deliense]|uniref:Endo-1:3(4)-beta-glucanase-like protein n=1 Tax=Leptotrombidium deliense TaxID=299467 RepID=A0A443SHD1_9ACAR|nr:endo-1:3(4)-beta-glucanase-like protein [Leptotrombidium deliense]